MEKGKIRLDKFLWSIRIFKTRAMAAEACDKNKVKYNHQPAKPAKQVQIGDEYDIKAESRKWIIKVTALLNNRVSYSEALKYYIDLTPEDANPKSTIHSSSFHTGKRLSKIGRPTKKQKRAIDDFLNPSYQPDNNE